MSGNSGKSTTLALILLSVGVLVFVLAAREARDRPTAISVTRATHQNLSSWITTNGKVEPLEPHTIQSQLTTFIETVALKEGQSVNRGQVLMTVNEALVENGTLFVDSRTRAMPASGNSSFTTAN